MWMSVFGMPPGTPTKKRTSQGSQGNLETRRWRLWLLRIQWLSQLRLQPWRLLSPSCASFQTFKGSSSWSLSWSLPLLFIHSWLCQGGGMRIFTFNPCRSGCRAWGETAAWPSTVTHQEAAEPTFCRTESLRSAPRASSRKRTKTPMPNAWSEGIWQGSIHPHLPDWPHRAHRPHRAHWHRHHQRTVLTAQSGQHLVLLYSKFGVKVS